MDFVTQPDTLLWTALLVLLGKIVWDWLKGRRDTNGSRLPHKCEKCLSKIDTLHVAVRKLSEVSNWLKEVHNMKNADGSYAWYTPKQTIEEVREETRKTNGLLQQIVAELKNLHESIVTIIRKN